MNFIELAFRLGVVFAIFAFIWGIFQLILAAFRGNRPKTVVEEYLLKSLQYFFLVDVTFLFSLKNTNSDVILPKEMAFSAFILLLYFLGKFQNRQQRVQLIQFMGSDRMNPLKPLFNKTAEIAIISLSIAFFTLLLFFPNYANNPISNWFYQNIIEIEQTFFFGFIFKIIGFFVLLGILFKLLNGISFLLSGKPLATVKTNYQKEGKKEEDNFDDFEEIN